MKENSMKITTEDCKKFIKEELLKLGIRSEEHCWKRSSKHANTTGSTYRTFVNPHVGVLVIRETEGHLALVDKQYIATVKEQSQFTLIGATFKYARESLKELGNWEDHAAIDALSGEELADDFLGAGGFSNEDDFAGLFEVLPANVIDYESVCEVSGVPADLNIFNAPKNNRLSRGL